MRNLGRLDNAELCKRQAWANALEQTRAVAEQDRDDVQLDLIDQLGGGTG